MAGESADLAGLAGNIAGKAVLGATTGLSPVATPGLSSNSTLHSSAFSGPIDAASRFATGSGTRGFVNNPVFYGEGASGDAGASIGKFLWIALIALVAFLAWRFFR